MQTTDLILSHHLRDLFGSHGFDEKLLDFRTCFVGDAERFPDRFFRWFEAGFFPPLRITFFAFLQRMKIFQVSYLDWHCADHFLLAVDMESFDSERIYRLVLDLEPLGLDSTFCLPGGPRARPYIVIQNGNFNWLTALKLHGDLHLAQG